MLTNSSEWTVRDERERPESRRIGPKHAEHGRRGLAFLTRIRAGDFELEAEERARYQSQFRWFLKKLEDALGDAGMRLVNLEGHPFDPGIAATALNPDDFGPDDPLVVDQMVEPVIMGERGVLKMGTITLRRASE